MDFTSFGQHYILIESEYVHTTNFYVDDSLMCLTFSYDKPQEDQIKRSYTPIRQEFL